jgi:hypothetical protein
MTLHRRARPDPHQLERPENDLAEVTNRGQRRTLRTGSAPFSAMPVTSATVGRRDGDADLRDARAGPPG